MGQLPLHLVLNQEANLDREEHQISTYDLPSEMLRQKFLKKEKNLATNSACSAKYRNVAIYEDVTPLRSRIMYELRHRDEKKAFRYVWSRGGRIFCKTPEQADMNPSPKPTVINKPEDLNKVGFSEEEIEAIILNKRD